MKYLRPFSMHELKADEHGPWLLAPEEGAGCAIRLRRGGGQTASPTVSRNERFALVLAGTAQLEGACSGSASEGDLIFIPAGIEGAVRGDDSSVWAEIEGEIDTATAGQPGQPRIIALNKTKFEGTGFAYQSLIDRSSGAQSARVNALKVQPGAGSPDFHIHAFAQIYIIQSGVMTIDVGRARFQAGPDTLVFLPAGVVHRNFNASLAIERHVSLLVPEPRAGEILDYAITIHDREAELLTNIPQ